MSEPPMPTATPHEDGFVVRGLVWAWKNYDLIKTRVKGVREWIFGKPHAVSTVASEPPRGVLIIGSGGAGKSTLARILSGDFTWLTDDPWEYGESYGIEQYTLQDDPKVSVVVPPGQHARRHTLWSQIEQDLSAGKYRGVILVSAYGYHSLAQGSYKGHPLYSGNKDQFLAEFTIRGREDEIAILKRLDPHIRAASGKMWLLSLVVKEDLWFKERDAVQAFYGGGEFKTLTEDLSRHRGVSNFRYELLPLSLVISNFMSRDGEMLRTNTAGYDHRRQVESVRRLFEVLQALMEWEAQP